MALPKLSEPQQALLVNAVFYPNVRPHRRRWGRRLQNGQISTLRSMERLGLLERVDYEYKGGPRGWTVIPTLKGVEVAVELTGSDYPEWH